MGIHLKTAVLFVGLILFTAFLLLSVLYQSQTGLMFFKYSRYWRRGINSGAGAGTHLCGWHGPARHFSVQGGSKLLKDYRSNPYLDRSGRAT
jgi:hypothetical protein